MNDENKFQNKILVSPLHYSLIKNKGSEFYWARKFYEYSEKIYAKRIQFITGASQINNKTIINLNIFNKYKMDVSLKKVFLFYIKTTFATIKYLDKNTKILHHFLPFQIGKSFNIVGILTNKRLIIGPIQLSLTFLDHDLSRKNIMGFKKENKKFTYHIEKIILLMIGPIINVLSYLTLKKADKLIVISENTKQFLLKQKIPAKKIEIIPPGIEISLYGPNKFKNNKKLKIISTGLLLERKGFDYAIRAIAEIVKLDKNIELTIVGDGPQKNKLQELVEKLNISNYVKFTGYVEHNQIPKLYAESDIFVSMSKSESWGQMYIEAMASHLPVIASKNNGSTSIVKDNFGFLIGQEDYKKLAELILYLKKHPKLFKQYSKNARNEVENNYDWKIIMKKYEKIYEELLG